MKGRKRYVYLLALALVALYLIIYIIPSLTGLFQTTETVENGQVEVSEEIQCYFARNEKVYTAPSDGKVVFIKKEGEKIRTGTKIARITKVKDEQAAIADTETVILKEPEPAFKDLVKMSGKAAKITKNFKAESSGVLCFYIDGYEEKLALSKIRNITYSEASDIDADMENIKQTGVIKGTPVYKISSDSEWYMFFWTDTNNTTRYQKGEKVTVDLNGIEVSCDIEDVSDNSDRLKVILRCRDYYKNFAKIRKMDVKVMSSRSAGLVISNECIFTKKGRPGVYVKTKTGDFVFKPVYVEATDGKRSIVTGTYFYDDDGNTVNTVNIYDEVKKHPGEGN